MDEWGTRKHITPSDSIMMALSVGIAGVVITTVIALVIGRAIDGVTADWPAPANAFEAMLVWAFSRLHLVVAAFGFYLVGDRVVRTIVHDRDQLHYQANARLEAELEREREDTRRMKIENDIAAYRLKALMDKPAVAQPELLVSGRTSSNWTLTVSHGVDKHELAGRFIEAYARGLRAGKTDLREYVRKVEGVSFQNRDYALLRALMQQGGVVTSKGTNTQQLTDQLDLWRTTHVARVFEREPLMLDEEAQ